MKAEALDEGIGKTMVNDSASSNRSPLDRENLEFFTDHLQLYEEIDKATRLYGEEYRPIIKALWYQIFSLPFRNIILRLGDIRTDARVSIAYPIASGSGKGNIEDAQKKISKAAGYSFESPNSCHPEALIGKVLRKGRKDPIFEEIRGPLDEDWVMLNEAIEIIRSSKEKYKESRKYLNTALDPIGTNEIVKRMTDLPKEHALRYMPNCIVTMFFQPFRVPEEVVLVGTFRRFLIIFSDVKNQMDLPNYDKRVEGKSNQPLNESIKDIVDELSEIERFVERGEGFKIRDEAKERFKELHLELIKQGFAHSEKCANYTRLVDFTLQDILLKMACIQAGTRKSWEVKTEDVEKAFVDLTEFFACTLDYIYRKVFGNLDYGEGWEGARKRDRECLEWLYEEGAISKEKSEVSASEYKQKVAEIFDVKEDMAQKHYKRQKEYNWVNYKQIGRYESRVWLNFEPEGGKDYKGSKEHLRKKLRKESSYFKIVKSIDKISSHTKTHDSEKDKTTDKTPTTLTTLGENEVLDDE